MAIIVDLQNASGCSGIPPKNKFTRWSGTCLESLRENAELTIRIVDEEEISELNRTWRGMDKPTNVLSFPAGDNPLAPEFLGDVVICAPIILQEAADQGKPADAHWAHMVIHGILHLLGYDHINDTDADEMEALEIKKLNLLNFPNPYN